MDPFNHGPHGIVPCNKGSAKYRVKRYRERAEELRSIADDMLHPECQSLVSRLAASYEAMADHEERPH
jgi:hypothetical protein